MSKIDVLAFGNAIVDISIRADDEFLHRNAILKGAMQLIDSKRADSLCHHNLSTTKTSGGSAANTAAALANFGANVAFSGKVAHDSWGDFFSKTLQEQQVIYNTVPLNDPNYHTARSIIFVTADGERSMNTYLGASHFFSIQDVNPHEIANSKILYCEGYLWDSNISKEAALLAIHLAHQAKNKVAINLSDSFCVARNREIFLSLIQQKKIHILFANEGELMSLYHASSLAQALEALCQHYHNIACITCSDKGSILFHGQEFHSQEFHSQEFHSKKFHDKKEIYKIPPFPVDNVVDTTGAGDLYAAGFLYAYGCGLSPLDSAALGSFAGGMIVQQTGSRAPFSLKKAAVTHGFLSHGFSI